MTSAQSSGDVLARRVVLITRIFDAPRPLAFKVWTDPKHVAMWWGPRGFTNPVCEWDARPGGAIRVHMRAPDGYEHPMSGTFVEVVEPERLVFTVVAEDKEGKPLLQGLTVVTFTEEGNQTKLTVEAEATTMLAIGAQMLQGMEQGWTESLERFAALLEKVKNA